jgi:predicted restriction endonuclease
MHGGLFAGNGLLLTPTIDHLFDRGFISFENGGELLISPVAHDESMNKMGIITDRIVNDFSVSDGEKVAAGRMRTEPQREFLEFHRDNVFLKREI